MENTFQYFLTPIIKKIINKGSEIAVNMPKLFTPPIVLKEATLAKSKGSANLPKS